jgi:hypothetical protein
MEPVMADWIDRAAGTGYLPEGVSPRLETRSDGVRWMVTDFPVDGSRAWLEHRWHRDHGKNIDIKNAHLIRSNAERARIWEALERIKHFDPSAAGRPKKPFSYELCRVIWESLIYSNEEAYHEYLQQHPGTRSKPKAATKEQLLRRLKEIGQPIDRKTLNDRIAAWEGEGRKWPPPPPSAELRMEFDDYLN